MMLAIIFIPRIADNAEIKERSSFQILSDSSALFVQEPARRGNAQCAVSNPLGLPHPFCLVFSWFECSLALLFQILSDPRPLCRHRHWCPADPVSGVSLPLGLPRPLCLLAGIQFVGDNAGFNSSRTPPPSSPATFVV